MIKEVAALYPDQVELKIYQAGRDMSYLRKYGNITRGTMVVGEQVKTEQLDRARVEKLIREAIGKEEGICHE